MKRIIIGRHPVTFEETMDALNSEIDFEVKGEIKDIQTLSPRCSLVVLMTDNEKEISLKTNKVKDFWVDKTQIGRKVVIKGKHSKTNDGVDQILSVRNCIDEQYLKRFAGRDVAKYEKLQNSIESVDDKYRMLLASKAPKITKHQTSCEDTSSLVALSHNKMLAKFVYLNDMYPETQRSIINGYFEAYDDAKHEEKEIMDKRLGFYINYIPGSATEPLNTDIVEVERNISKEYPGQKGVVRGLINCLMKYQMDPLHKAPRILIMAPKKMDIQRLVFAFFKYANLKYVTYSCAGVSDAANLQGSSRIYSNCNIGSFANSLCTIESGAMLFYDLDMATKPEALMPIQGIVDGWYVNEMLESPVDVSGEWVIMTCTNDVKVPLDLSTGVTVLEAGDFSERDMLDQADSITRRFLMERGISEKKIALSARVKKDLVTRYTGRDDCRELQENIYDILQNALYCNMGSRRQIRINEDNFEKYFSLFEESEHLRCDQLNGISDVRKKLRLYSDWMPLGMCDCIHNGIDELETTTDEEERKRLTKNIIELGNIRIREPLVIDFEEVQRAFDTMYALYDVKERVLDCLMSVSGKEEFRFTPIIFYGPSGVGKSTLAKAIAEALSLPCINYAFNQCSDPRDFTGYPPYAKSCRKGLLGRLLEEKTDRACVIIDELDKPLVNGMYEVLHNILDRQDAYDQEYDCFYNTDKILFIATANDLGAIPETVRNRCELIPIKPYSIRERMEMAKKCLLPKALGQLGIEGEVWFDDEVLRLLLTKYTVTGGVRETEVAIERILRRMMRKKRKRVITLDLIRESLGVPLSYECDGEKEEGVCGVAKALAVTGTGGMLFRIRTCHNPYGPELEITGLAKDSFLESIKVAMSLASRLMDRRLDNVAIHCDASGIQKDGPSAGLCVLSSILSLESNIPLPSSVAFTGEIDINGKRVHAVGGILEKLTAAERSVETIYIPAGNYEQLASEGALDKFDLKIVPVTSVDDLIKKLFPNSEFPGDL